MQSRKYVILDTDLGNDSDDIGAISIMCNLYKKDLIDILAVTVENSQIDTYLATDILLSYYGVNCPLGLCDTPLGEDPMHGTYARALRFAFKSKREGEKPESAVRVLRRALVKGNVTLVTIGMLTNVSNLLESKGDDISPLTGRELFERGVSEMHIMGGSFSLDMSEWNITEDIKSAMNVINTTNVKKTFVPFEIGVKVKSGRNLLKRLDTPMGVGYYVHNIRERESWDPITMYEALIGLDDFSYSEYGKVKIEENGRSVFERLEDGKDRYIKDCLDYKELEERIEELMVA